MEYNLAFDHSGGAIEVDLPTDSINYGGDLSEIKRVFLLQANLRVLLSVWTSWDRVCCQGKSFLCRVTREGFEPLCDVR